LPSPSPATSLSTQTGHGRAGASPTDRRGVVVGPSGDAPTSMVPRGAVPVKERNQWGRRRSPHGEGCFWPQLHVLGNRNTRVRVQVPQERRQRATEIYVNDAAARYPRQSLFAAASCLPRLPREGEPQHTEHTTFFLRFGSECTTEDSRIDSRDLEVRSIVIDA
jgi:hypothetical protein